MKRIKNIKNLILLCVLLISLSAGAQQNKEVWTLQQCVEYARENSLEVQQRLINVYFAELQEAQANWNKFGSANASITESFSMGRVLNNNNNYVDVNSWNTNVNASYNVMLFNSFRLQNLHKVQTMSLRASEADLEQLREDISLQVVMAYLDVIFSKEMVESSKWQLEISKVEQKRIQTRYDLGEAAKDQVLENASQLAREESALMDAQAQETITLLKLKQLLNVSEEVIFDIVEPITQDLNAEISLASATDLYLYAVNNRPSVKAVEYRIKGDELQLKANKAQLYPSIGAGYSLRTNYNDFEPNSFFKQISGQVGHGFGASLSIPIFDGFQARNNVKSAKMQIQSRELDLQIIKRDLKATLQRVYNDALTASKKYEASKKVVEASQASFEFAQQKYNFGAMSVFDYNVSKNNLAKAEIELIQAKYQFIFASKVLDYYRGMPLKM